MIGGVEMTCEESDKGTLTTISGTTTDQAGLIGFINALFNLGYIVTRVEQISPDDPIDSEVQSQDENQSQDDRGSGLEGEHTVI